MNPFVPLAAAHVLVAVTWPFLPPRCIFRPLLVALVTICCAVSLKSIDKYTWWGAELAEYVCGFAMYVSYFLCVRNLVSSNVSSPWRKVKAESAMLFSSRADIAAKDLPAFAAGNPEYVPTSRVFLIARLWTLVWTASAFALLHNYPLDLWPDDFESPKHQILRRLPDVSAREWIILFHTSVCAWFMPYCLFTAAHSLASIVAVTSGDAPINWRPLFGDIREAYTVQRFFGIFWHKLMRKAFTGHASLLVHDVLGMPRRAPQSRAAIIIVSFMISGAMHSLVAFLPLTCAGPQLMLYYGGLGMVVALENGVQQIYWRYSTTLKQIGVDGNKSSWRVLGYLWVIFFHVWTTAKGTYPLAFCDSDLLMKT